MFAFPADDIQGQTPHTLMAHSSRSSELSFGRTVFLPRKPVWFLQKPELGRTGLSHIERYVQPGIDPGSSERESLSLKHSDIAVRTPCLDFDHTNPSVKVTAEKISAWRSLESWLMIRDPLPKHAHLHRGASGGPDRGT